MQSTDLIAQCIDKLSAGTQYCQKILAFFKAFFQAVDVCEVQ